MKKGSSTEKIACGFRDSPACPDLGWAGEVIKTHNVDKNLIKIQNMRKWRYTMNTWRLDGTILTTFNCEPTHTFTDKLPYTLGLTITRVSDGNAQTFPDQTIQVKDYFIVSIGDSYGSDQGNPDIEQEVFPGPFGFGWVLQSEALWQDERCHRSANAAPGLGCPGAWGV